MSATQRMSERPTLEQVGELAGVSRATVSRVINGSPKVSPEARAAVEQAIAALGYAPNRAARSLVTRRADAVALVVCEPEERVFAEPFFAAVARGVSVATAKADKSLVLVIASDERERVRARRYLTPHHVDGVVLMSLHGDDPLPAQLEDAGLPTVLVGRPLGAPVVPFVDADNRGGARLAVEYLLGLGRKEVATITGPSSMCAGLDRYDGYVDALAAAGLEADSELVEVGDFAEESGYRGMWRLLGRRPGLDAVFVASDLMASGALRALRDAGRSVPGDVAIVGFDDFPLAAHTVPSLTTIRQPLDDMTRATADILLRRIAGDPPDGDHVVCTTSLVRRRSA
jgi:DNA-binding LacI/PurR family transcriptional regulator